MLNLTLGIDFEKVINPPENRILIILYSRRIWSSNPQSQFYLFCESEGGIGRWMFWFQLCGIRLHQLFRPSWDLLFSESWSLYFRWLKPYKYWEYTYWNLRKCKSCVKTFVPAILHAWKGKCKVKISWNLITRGAIPKITAVVVTLVIVIHRCLTPQDHTRFDCWCSTRLWRLTLICKIEANNFMIWRWPPLQLLVSKYSRRSI